MFIEPQGYRSYLDSAQAKLSNLKSVVIGGSSFPRAMTGAFDTKYGLQVTHA